MLPQAYPPVLLQLLSTVLLRAVLSSDSLCDRGVKSLHVQLMLLDTNKIGLMCVP